VEHGGDNDRLD
jgi:ATP-binding cassette, subfamily B (MDR/TAP), member 1